MSVSFFCVLYLEPYFFSFLPYMKFLNFLKSKGLITALTVGASIAPLAASAAFEDGMILPGGTITNVTTAFTTYFFPTLLATIFQTQVISIVVAVAAVYVMWRILLAVFNSLHVR